MSQAEIFIQKLLQNNTKKKQKTLTDRSHFNYQRIYIYLYAVDRSSTLTKHVNEMNGKLKRHIEAYEHTMFLR